MAKKKPFTARYKVIRSPYGNRYCFFCGASGAAVCTTKAVHAETAEEELCFAWESEARQYFNQCHKCGKWICDVMYNADTLNCVDCSPWEEQPRFCPGCGAAVGVQDVFCPKCGIRLMYGGDVDDGTDGFDSTDPP